MDNHKERAFYAVVGAFVGDAASMGLHWLYDQERILHVAGFEPEFRSTKQFDYQDKGYFADPYDREFIALTKSMN